ncbi:hypothetical protein BAMA_10305 [Bacillus manliponensis]|uniref:Uncharacterized protein n=1 Tax=Bacillus manliponensis TaxID=574376 RepID=A0A073JUM2_9BACI|nr:hypothetical protein [Bacillus manliponensis]KEK17876.1 hypothetical protein BAMA_10305 [Bacillus manliponensis]
MVRQPGRVKGLCYDYKQAFLQDLESYRITDGEFLEPYDEQIYNLIHEMVPLRNNYIEFLEQLCGNETLFDIKIITSLLEALHAFSGPLGRSGPAQFEHYRYFIHEIFLYTTAILISRQMYNKLNEICKHRYFVKNIQYYELVDGSYGMFYFYLQSLVETRNNRLSLKRVSVQADLIKDLSSSSRYSWDSLMEADFVLYYIQDIQNLEGKKQGRGGYWYPVTSAYVQFSYPTISLLQRLKSKAHFDDIKSLFSIKDVEHLQRIMQLSLEQGRVSGVPSLAHMLPNEIAVY